MPLAMFRLQPGQALDYALHFPGLPLGPLGLRAGRPDEGRSAELELQLFDPEAGRLGRGRVPIERGYLAVVREIDRQLEAIGHPACEQPEGARFELRRQAQDPPTGALRTEG